MERRKREREMYELRVDAVLCHNTRDVIINESLKQTRTRKTNTIKREYKNKKNDTYTPK